MRSAGLFSIAALVIALPALARAQYVVTSPERGVLRVSADGAVDEVLSATPAARGVMRNAHAMVFLAQGSNELRELDLVTHAERTIATLPGDVGLGCGGTWGSPGALAEPYLVADALEFEESMAADDARVCFELMDRNLNMASVLVLMDVDLATGTVSHQVTVSEECGIMDDDAREALPCAQLIRARQRDASRPSRRVPDAWSIAASGERAFLVGPSGRRALGIREPMLEQTSRDGRWAVISGNRDEGDYIYRSLYLLDVRRGVVHPIVARTDEGGPADDRHAWPPPLDRATLGDPERVADFGYGVTGETSITWIDRGRTLVLDGRLVVRPGRGSFVLPGRLVR